MASIVSGTRKSRHLTVWLSTSTRGSRRCTRSATRSTTASGGRSSATVGRKFLGCGDLKHSFARVRCVCPSCHQKRAPEKAGWVAEYVCAEMPHQQFVFTIPRRLRIYFRSERRLLGELCRAAAPHRDHRLSRRQWPARRRAGHGGCHPDLWSIGHRAHSPPLRALGKALDPRPANGGNPDRGLRLKSRRSGGAVAPRLRRGVRSAVRCTLGGRDQSGPRAGRTLRHACRRLRTPSGPSGRPPTGPRGPAKHLAGDNSAPFRLEWPLLRGHIPATTTK